MAWFCMAYLKRTMKVYFSFRRLQRNFWEDRGSNFNEQWTQRVKGVNVTSCGRILIIKQPCDLQHGLMSSVV